MFSEVIPDIGQPKNLPDIFDENQVTKQRLAQGHIESQNSDDDENPNYLSLHVRMAKGIILKRRKREKEGDNQTWSMSSQTMTGKYSILSYQLGCYSNLYHSKILSSYGKIQLLFKQKVQIKMIFSASQQGFSAKRFHQLCDLYLGTLVLCLTESNKILGGYTTLSWKENYEKGKTYFKTDDNYQTFMFSWDRKQKYYLAKSINNKAICCFNGFGPSFGYDLQIGNDTFANANTSVEFPSNYYSSQKGSTPTRYQVFGTSKNEIKLKDYQVYQIIKKQQRKSMNKGRIGLLTARQQICVNTSRKFSQTQQI